MATTAVITVEGIEYYPWDVCGAPDGCVMGRERGYVKNGVIHVRADIQPPAEGWGEHICSGTCSRPVLV